jgi:tRNA-dihydrouridine synthase B
MEFLGFQLRNNLFVAPMAGVTDRPFRQLCKKLGAGLAVSEMVTSNSLLYGSAKTRRRANHEGEVDPISVQIAGADPAMMAQAARYNADHGAQIIDINMGCPAKKVCNVMAGSALMQNEPLVAKILEAVVGAVPDTAGDAEVPHRLEPRQSQRADASRASPRVGHPRHRHPRPHACRPVHGCRRIRHHCPGQVAGRDSGDRQRRHHHAAEGPHVLDYTGADGVMIGRAAQGRPWLFREIEHFLATGEEMAPPRRTRSIASCAGTWPISTASTAKRPACASRASTSVGTPRAWSARRISAMP